MDFDNQTTLVWNGKTYSIEGSERSVQLGRVILPDMTVLTIEYWTSLDNYFEDYPKTNHPEQSGIKESKKLNAVLRTLNITDIEEAAFVLNAVVASISN